MSLITSDDISFVLSGGTANNNPNFSLGGNPSNKEITGVVNNLFSNVSPNDATDGKTDYRCFYIFNDSEENSLFDSYIYFSSQVDEGSDCLMGVRQATDVQKIAITTATTGGNLVMLYEDTQFTWNWNANKTIWAQNLATALNNLEELQGGVTVQHAVMSGKDTFVVTFGGNDDNRNHELLAVFTDNLLPSQTTVTITKVTEGSPINTVASTIAAPTVPPTGVVFIAATSDDPIAIGKLRPGDGVPVWIKRVTQADSPAMPDDGFSFVISGKPF